MSARAGLKLIQVLTLTYKAEDTTVNVDFCPVKFGSTDEYVVGCNADDADMIGWARFKQSKVGANVSVIALGSPAVIAVTVGASSTATRGKWAVGVSGAKTYKNAPTINGGSTLAYIRGKFLQSGVAGDKVEMLITSGGFALTA